MSEFVQNSSRPRGRPRAFDENEVLDKAILAFRQRGLEGVTIDELAACMGLNKPSVYRAFGDRNAVYQRAVERYGDLVAADWNEAARAATSPQHAAECFLKVALDWFTPSDTSTAGCLIICTMPASSSNEQVRSSLAAFLHRADEDLSDYFFEEFGESAGLSRSTAVQLCLLLNGCVHSMAIRSSSGADRDALWQVAQTTLEAACTLLNPPSE